MNGARLPGQGRTALITGASAGIGAAFARECAGLGFDLVLTARREDRLEALAGEIRTRTGRTVYVFPADLADQEAPATLKAALDERGITVDLLINNAGYGVMPHFADLSWEENRAFEQVMVRAPLHLAHLLLPEMIARGWGRVLNVASVAGFMPGTRGASQYGASKSFLIKWSESLFLELEGTGVSALALCPGFTYSEFHDVTGTRESVSKMPDYMWMSAEDVVRQGMKACLAARHAVYVTGWVNRGLVTLAKILPSFVLLKLSRMRARQEEREARERG